MSEVTSEPDRFRADAEHSKLTGQVREFLAFLGQGRKLTQTGRITLADARHLVGRLGTGDELDPKYGSRVFRTTSSAELGGLMRVVDWAKAARLVRVVHGRLVPVKKNAALAARPGDLVLTLLEAYPKIGSLFPRSDWRQSLVGDEFADIGPALLTELARSPGPVELAHLAKLAGAMIESRYMLRGLSDVQLDHLRRINEIDTRVAMEHLQALGVAALSRNSGEVSEHGTPDWSMGTVELTGLGRYSLRRLKGMAEPGDPVLTIRVTLLQVDSPAVWRRVVVPASFTLDRVHGVIQAAMGWWDYHLHDFRIGDKTYGMPELDEFGDSGELDEKLFRLGDLVRPGDVIGYRYDFGDCWEHEILVEAAGTAADGVGYPFCADGDGACPREDCGGAGGFAELKEILAGPGCTERDEMRTWAGADYDPARFDLAAANAALSAA